VLGVIDIGATTTVVHQQTMYDIEGGIILPPGSYVHIYTSTASAATSFFGSLTWEEVPV
jgi:hypothetical protein